jgi:hypothetical protein
VKGSAVFRQSGSTSPCLREPSASSAVTVQPDPGQALIEELCRFLRHPHSATVGLASSRSEAGGYAGFQGTFGHSRDRDES